MHALGKGCYSSTGITGEVWRVSSAGTDGIKKSKDVSEAVEEISAAHART
ncbi:hypothetical protein CCP3SC1AL1_160029 [Gammaproteobacteria bacterium]